eukprot:CAMPEP_0115060688 /NCGR_PEP_ID=MMETSP0227-20121206/7596_1 /TAXON_ID=89957 /ORGANISM="Polarella glacialis, Strain CCMP 1383" /LENGTH=100 /DNA_ID=CAMNT_0002445917 /DNA_START=835 /DNA_END=1137 /DNA_ORIENTATION=-
MPEFFGDGFNKKFFISDGAMLATSKFDFCAGSGPAEGPGSKTGQSPRSSRLAAKEARRLASSALISSGDIGLGITTASAAFSPSTAIEAKTPFISSFGGS